MIIKKIEDETISILEDAVFCDSPNIEEFKDWLRELYPDKNSLKSVVVGCAVFRLNESHKKLFETTKKEKQKRKYNITISNMYLDVANEFLSCS